MAKGDKRRKKKQDAAIRTIRESGSRLRETDSGSGVGGVPAVRKCWEFVLTEPTSVAVQLVTGDSLVGSARRPSVLVMSDTKGTVGLVPGGVASEMLSALAEDKRARLRGAVLSKQSSDALVQLCLEIGP